VQLISNIRFTITGEFGVNAYSRQKTRQAILTSLAILHPQQTIMLFQAEELPGIANGMLLDITLYCDDQQPQHLRITIPPGESEKIEQGYTPTGESTATFEAVVRETEDD